MYVNDKCHHKEWLDIDVFEEVIFVKWPLISTRFFYQKYVQFQIIMKRMFRYLCRENEVC